jgi:FimV-like protein
MPGPEWISTSRLRPTSLRERPRRKPHPGSISTWGWISVEQAHGGACTDLEVDPTQRSQGSHGGAPSIDLADLSLDMPGGSSGGGGDGVGTKLELAKAYLEIGDKDGARDILQEVAKEGSASQKEEAQRLIASL